MKSNNTLQNATDFKPGTDDVLKEVIEGLQQPVKRLPCKLFYDEHGSQLFDQICELDEYYPTRTETAIMEDNIDEIVSHIGEDCQLIEYGSGSSVKTRILLDNLPEMAAYVPIDISKEHLLRSSVDLAQDYPNVDVFPVCADYHNDFDLPDCKRTANKKVVYFPGSTIGNFHPHEAVDFLQGINEVCGDQGGLLIGVDLKKDPDILNEAYNDSKGVTAAFNLNSVKRVKEELGIDLDPDSFRHHAFYNEAHGRVEMHLVSLLEQKVSVAGNEIVIKSGESIWTESSYKYSVEEFDRLAFKGGFQVEKVWVDDQQLFSVQYLTIMS